MNMLSFKLEDNIAAIKRALGNSGDIKYRELQINGHEAPPVSGVIVYVDGLSELQTMIHSLLTGILADRTFPGATQLLEHCKMRVISEGDVADLFDHLLSGNSILMLEGSAKALSVGTKQLKARSVEEPTVQSVVRGPREGFTEVLRWNTAMLRRKINDRNLWMETMKVGKVTKTEVAIVYLKGIAREQLVDDVRSRIKEIDIDGVLESNYIEEHIQDKRKTTFPTVFNSERPDVIAAGLMEGRVAIMVDGTPFALQVPALFSQFFQSSEDYYQRTDFATLIRLLRFLALALATITPSVYIAVTTFHQEMLPTTLLYNLTSQREGVPFPAFIEALVMEVTFEILREASVRMPKTIGQAISIVGTLVVGQAAVEAGLVSAAMVIVVSVTAISNFVIPAFNMGISARIVRFFLMFLSATFGLFGMFIGLIMIVSHLCSLRSMGVPYMAPVAPFYGSDQKDTLLRLPIKHMFKRPKSLKPLDPIRQSRKKQNQE
jgi:spore germination protein KA